MSAIALAARLGRLVVALEMRDAVIAPVLAVVAAAPPNSRLLVGASTQGRRVQLIMPDHPGALVALGVSSGACDGDHQRGIRIVIEQDRLAIGVVVPAAQPVAAAVRGAPPEIRPAWQAVLDQFCAIGTGRVLSVTEWRTEQRTRVDVRYPARDPATDQVVLLGIDQLAGDLGVSAMQRRLLVRMHPTLGKGQPLVVGTTATTQITSQLSVVYGATDWDTAIRVGSGLVLNDSEAKEVPARLGALAGALGSEAVEGLELELGPHEPPGVVVWSNVSPSA